MTIPRNQPLTPSAGAREVSDGMSQRYTSIPIIEVVNGHETGIAGVQRGSYVNPA